MQLLKTHTKSLR